MANEPRKIDYTGNADKEKAVAEDKPEKVVEKIVETKVIVKKKGIGQKIKNLFAEADFRGVVHYVAVDVLIPAARNMIVDGATEGIHRIIYGERRGPRSMYGGGPSGPRISYSTPVNRSGSPLSRHAPPQSERLGARMSRHIRDDFILVSRSEADLVLERLGDIIDSYQVASVADLKDLMGVPSTHVDQKWGWTFVGDAAVRQVRDGFIIDLPPEEPLQ